MGGGGIIGGIIGVIVGIALITFGFKRGASVTVTNDAGQSAPVSGNGAKWILIILGVIAVIGGIVALGKSAAS